MVAFGIVGYLMKKAGFDPGPMVLAFVLGSIIESSTRRSLLIFGGDPTGFFTRPISGTILAILVVLALLPAVRYFLKRRADGKTTDKAAESSETPTEVGVWCLTFGGIAERRLPISAGFGSGRSGL